MPLYTKLFNIIFETGIFPTQWLCGEIIPIYKNKGDEMDPKKYRPITLLCCLGKLFTSVLNERLNKYADAVELLLQNQAGFRKNYSTCDHIFSFHILSELFKGTKKKLYCAFIDFEKAFDSVWRIGLWNKLLRSNIDGKCFKIISNMYDGIKAKIKFNGVYTDSFPCQIGVRQGENLSPFLFSIFLNDLETFLTSNGALGLPTISAKFENELNMYMNLFVLLYADDTILLAETPDGLQKQLNIFSKYCNLWRLKVNAEKTKVMIFGSRKNQYVYTFNGNVIEIVEHFRYLGVYFARNGSFSFNIKQQHLKATKAMYSLLQKCKSNNLPIDCQFELFDKIIMPILLYGSEIWGFSNTTLLEKLHLIIRFCKYVLKLNNCTPNYMVYGELGRYPLSINIKVRMVTFWGKLVCSQAPKLSLSLYNIAFKTNLRWAQYIKSIFDEWCIVIYMGNTKLC